MAHLVRQIARGTKAKVDNYAGPAGELVMDTTSNDLVLQTGTAGGVRMAKASTVIAASNGVEISAGGSLATGATVSGIDATTSAKGVVQLSSLTSGASETLAATEKAVGDALQAAKDYTDATVKTYTGAAPIGVSASNEISISPATTAAAGSMSAADKTKLDGIVDMTGASASAAGAHGLVPQPAAGDDAKFLKGDGTWASAGETYTAAAPLSIDSNNEISVADATASSKGVVQVGDNVTVSSGTISVKPWADHVANHTSAVLADYQEGAIIETDEPIAGNDAVLAEVEHTFTGAATKVPASDALSAYFSSPAFLAAVAHAAMPSATYEPLTFGNGEVYTVPADGYVNCMAKLTGANSFYAIYRRRNNIRIEALCTQFPSKAGYAGFVMAVSAGDEVQVACTAAELGDTGWYRFYYCNGTVPTV